MIASWLAEHAQRRSQAVLIAGEKDVTYGAAFNRVRELADNLPIERGRAGALSASLGIELLWHLLAFDMRGVRVCLLAPGTKAVVQTQETLKLDYWVDEQGFSNLEHSPGPEAILPPGVVMFTSGTTGMPKGVFHNWHVLAAQVKASEDLRASRWLLTYGLSSFAGLQTLLHVLKSGASLVMAGETPAQSAARANRFGVTHISATPSYLRLLLASAAQEDLRDLRLRQITLGGEAVDQPVLTALRSQFPESRITHIYASTELGVCWSVHDGLAGFPAAFLSDPDRDVRLNIRDGELLVSLPTARRSTLLDARSKPDDEDYYPTGDMVERRGERVFFRGRVGDRINVGGHKVFPHEVEHVVLQIDGVAAARVTGAPSSVMGQIIKCEVVPMPHCDPQKLRHDIIACGRERLSPHQRPRLVEIVHTLPTTTSGKIERRSE